MQIEHGYDRLRADVLNPAGGGDMGLGGLEECGGDLLGGVGTKLPIPFFRQPQGEREFGGAVGPGDGSAVDFAQHGIHEPSGGLLARAFHQFDAFADRGVRGDAVQVAELVHAHAQGDANLLV